MFLEQCLWGVTPCSLIQVAAYISGVPRGVVWGVQTPPEVIGEVLDRVSKKNRLLDFLL